MSVSASLLVLGAGGHGKVVAEAAAQSSRWTEIAFLDDHIAVGETVAGFAVIGAFHDIHGFAGRDLVVAVGDNAARLSTVVDLVANGFSVVPVVHPAAVLSPTATIGPGTVVMAGAILQCDARAGCAAIVNTASSVDHECKLADGVHISPGARIGGGCEIGARSWIGIGASLKHGTVVGSDVTVGAGAAVVSDLPDGVLAVGVPARVIAVLHENA